MLPKQDNIVAIATAQGRGGIGIVRISGHGLSRFAELLLGRVPRPRYATYTRFFDALGGVIDQGVALYFPAPHSYTGEDVLELHGHGGSIPPQLVLQRCLELGARLANPGEFTQRAFLNNKLDLAQAESVADLIDATTGQAAKSALRSLQGDFSQLIHRLVERLIQLRAFVEAMLDFPDEEIDASTFQHDATLALIRSELEAILGLAKQGSILREGAHIVLVGQPNVGKSSLLNCLSGEDVALVSDVPGTTRDAIRLAIQLDGVPLHIIDTAGLRDSMDKVEQMGIARTHGAVQKADAILLIVDASRGFGPDDERIVQTLPPAIPRLRIFNKIDLIDEVAHAEDSSDGSVNIFLSVKTGAGVELLRNKILSLIGWSHDSGVFMARERHIQALMQARNYLNSATEVSSELELFAEDLRLAQDSLNIITGEFTSDELLGEIFGKFCIGK